ncbi:MAG: UDP-glucuronosyltransferase [Rhodocyclales bacterium]|nr:UDP-glucuronosyltransferase [Rhodocyclales bacterium]
MAKIAYAWEFGANLGHIGAYLPMARALRERGHAVHWIVAQVGSAARLLDQEGFSWLQAPTLPEARRDNPPLAYADILLRFGYANAADLLGLVVAWRELFRLTGARLVMADHAPTALLAARTLGLPAVLFSSGFCVPPRQYPLPNMRPWIPLPAPQLLAIEQEALAAINTVLARFDQAPLTAVWQLFDVAEDTLLGFPELDHYGERGPARYWGNLPDAGIGAAPAWPALPGKRLFAYLRTECPHHEAALAALAALGQPTVVFFPHAPAATVARFASPHLVFSTAPLDLERTAAAADAAVTYASLSTTTRFLLAGKPLLLLPGHLEQYLMARRVEEMGAGLLADPEKPAADLPQKLQRIVYDSSFAANAGAFAAKYAAFPQNVVIGNIARRVEELLTRNGAPP